MRGRTTSMHGTGTLATSLWRCSALYNSSIDMSVHIRQVCLATQIRQLSPHMQQPLPRPINTHFAGTRDVLLCLVTARTPYRHAGTLRRKHLRVPAHCSAWVSHAGRMAFRQIIMLGSGGRRG